VSNGVILDTGPLVAFLDRAEGHHAWVCARFRDFRLPLLTCEPVITEALFLLRKLPVAQDKLLGWVEEGHLQVCFRLQDEVASVRRILLKYRDLPMSLADACLVLLAEGAMLPICTLDSHFSLYRKRGSDPLSLVLPGRP
jgi:predicted nucleic acid-binding protein